MKATGKVVVGFESGGAGPDVAAFARLWAQASGDELVVVTVHPGAAPVGAGRVDAEWVAYEREAADALLAEARGLIGGGVTASYRRVDASSAAHGLYDLLESQPGDSPLLVLGSRSGRGQRRTYPGSTADRMLHGSPAPVAMVPWGYADGVPRPIERVAVAYVDTSDGALALDHATRIAQHLSAALLVISVVPDTRVAPSLGDVRTFGTEQASDYRTSLEVALAGVPTGIDAAGELRDGPVVDALTDIRPGDADLLVCGSRGYGPLRSVLLGGVSSRVVRHSRVPVVIVPRAS